jgi:uncharacterized Zn-binding protein involved in type VI secretion
MLGSFGCSEFGSTEFIIVFGDKRQIVVVGDKSSHGGMVISSNQDGTLKAVGIEVAVDGALHSCPIFEHGITPISSVIIKTYQNSRLLLTRGAIAGCGALLDPPSRNVYVE